MRLRFVLLSALLAVASPACSSDDDAGDGASAGHAGSDDGDNAGRGGNGDGGTGTGNGSGTGGRGGSAGENAGNGGAGEDGGDGGAAGSQNTAGDDGGGEPSSDCNAEPHEHEHTSQAAMHVNAPLPASDYNSSPPSSGMHCPMWGAYTIYPDDSPLPACNFLHDLEHGGIALLYNCPDGCPEIADALEQVIADAPADPDCGSSLKRLLLTPYMEMDATVAASAWGFTWTADCLDDAAIASLQQFIAAHWGSSGDAPESTVCVDGQVGP